MSKFLLFLTLSLFLSLSVGAIASACTTSNCVDFGNAVGTVDLIYGVNEDDNWYNFTHNAINQQRHREAGTRSVRVWLSAQSYRQSTFPYDGSNYDWRNVDDFVDAALRASVGDNPPLYITFAHYDLCGSGGPFDFSSGCEGHDEPAPTNNQDFANYVVNVVNHFIDKCNAGQYANGKPCDPVNDWYYEILNEPNSISQSDYKAIVNTVHNTLVSQIGDLKLAAYHQTSDINGADFSVTHNYPGNVCSGSSNQQKMDCAGNSILRSSRCQLLDSDNPSSALLIKRLANAKYSRVLNGSL